MHKNKQRGFTLIELMIVVAIIGILAAVAIPKFADMLRKSKEGSTKGSLTNLRSALTIYVSDNEGSTPLLHTAESVRPLIPKYIEIVPMVKLGTYHVDTSSITPWIPNGEFDQNRSSSVIAALNQYGWGDISGWTYCSQAGGAFWVGCSHTDAKNGAITAW